MTTLSALKKQWLKDGKVREHYEEHALEFNIAQKLLSERLKANLTQEEVAKRMNTTQSAIARLESGGQLPTMRTIEHYAEALGKYPALEFKDAR